MQAYRRHFEKQLQKASEDVLREWQGDAIDAASSIAPVMMALVEYSAEQTGCDDRWFFDVACHGTRWLESLGVAITEHELEHIADGHFNSWLPPEEDAAERFADEVAAFVARRLFETRYPAPEDP